MSARSGSIDWVKHKDGINRDMIFVLKDGRTIRIYLPVSGKPYEWFFEEWQGNRPTTRSGWVMAKGTITPEDIDYVDMR